MSEQLGIVIVISIGFIAVTIAISVFALFPLLRQVRQILSRVDTLLLSLEADVRVAVSELRGAIQNVNQISAGVNKNMNKVEGAVHALEGLGETLTTTSNIIRATVNPRLLSFGALVVGLRTGSWYLFRKFIKKRR
ncbi:MAG: DUF948 domain-containing protein [Candidatus Methylomirabilales bacterium]